MGRPFATREAAEQYAVRKIDGAPWDYEVIEPPADWAPDWP